MSVSSAATPLQPGQPVSSTLPTDNDRDDYAIDVRAGYSYAFTIARTASFIDVALVDASGADAAGSVARYGYWNDSFSGYFGPNAFPAAAATPSGNFGYGSFTKTFTAVSTGTVYLQVDGRFAGILMVGQPTPAAAYTITLGAPDDVGATPATASQLPIGGTVSGHFDVQNDIDEYAVALQAGQTYEFDNLSYTAYEMTLLDAGGSVLAHWSPYYPALTYTPAQTGTYYLDVSTQQSFSIAPYTLGAKLLPPPALPATAPPASTPPTTAASTPPTAQATQPATVTPAPISIYRLFDSTTGAQFLTADATEASTLLATRPDWVDQGVGLQSAAPADRAATPVYRFFDTGDGSHFLTTSTTERDTILASRPDLTLEGVGLSEYATPQPGAAPVYRYFDTNGGGHFYTASALEAAAIAATRPDLRLEGIAFYAPG